MKYWRQYVRAVVAVFAVIAIGYVVFRAATPVTWGNPQNVTTGAAILLAAYILARSRTPEILKAELDATRGRCERFEEENKTLVESNHKKDMEIADLKARTDLSQIQKTQEKTLMLVSTCAQTLESVSKTLERISGSLPIVAQLMKTPPATT